MNCLFAVALAVGVCAARARAQSQDASNSALENSGSFLTTNFGVPEFTDSASLTVGPRGKIAETNHPIWVTRRRLPGEAVSALNMSLQSKPRADVFNSLCMALRISCSSCRNCLLGKTHLGDVFRSCPVGRLSNAGEGCHL